MSFEISLKCDKFRNKKLKISKLQARYVQVLFRSSNNLIGKCFYANNFKLYQYEWHLYCKGIGKNDLIIIFCLKRSLEVEVKFKKMLHLYLSKQRFKFIDFKVIKLTPTGHQPFSIPLKNPVNLRIFYQNFVKSSRM